MTITLYNKFNQSLHYDKEKEKNPSLTLDLTFKEATLLLSSPSMENNHILLNESLLSINESLKLLETINLNLSLIPKYINYTLPRFLVNITSNLL